MSVLTENGNALIPKVKSFYCHNLCAIIIVLDFSLVFILLQFDFYFSISVQF